MTRARFPLVCRKCCKTVIFSRQDAGDCVGGIGYVCRRCERLMRRKRMSQAAARARKAAIELGRAGR